MRISAIDRITPDQSITSLPVRLHQTSSRARAAATLGLIVPLFATLILPFGLVAALAAEQPEALNALADRPAATALLGAGLLIGIALLAHPLRRIVAGLGTSRIVEIDGATVSVTDRSAFGARTWSEPVAAFSGIAHHVRASLSGTRHEVVLVHPDRRRSVLLEIADRLPQSRLDALTQILGRPELPARVLYGKATA